MREAGSRCDRSGPRCRQKLAAVGEWEIRHCPLELAEEVIPTALEAIGVVEDRPERNRPIILDAIRIFGVDRCMFASTFPVERNGPLRGYWCWRNGVRPLPPRNAVACKRWSEGFDPRMTDP